MEDLGCYIQKGIELGATHAKLIHPGTVVTAAWVGWKCQFGCRGYGERHTCPPYTPTWDITRQLLDCYKRAILFHWEAQATPERSKTGKEFLDKLVELEGEMFKDGYYKAFVLLAGPCQLCKKCARQSDMPCNFGGKARPAMEACGIDVFKTAIDNGFEIVPLKDKGETRNIYCLMLVD